MVAQPGDRVRVQVVRRLVQQQHLRVAEQDPGQLDPAPLAPGQGAERLVHHPVGQPEAGGEGRRLRFGRVPAQHGHPLFQPGVPADGRVGPVPVRVGHLHLGLAHPGAQFVEAARGQHAVHRHDVQVAGARILGQVTDGAAAPDGPGRGQRLAGQHLEQGCLTGPVPAHQADPVAGPHLEIRAVQQQPCAGAQFYPTCHNHEKPLLLPSTHERGQSIRGGRTGAPADGPLGKEWRHRPESTGRRVPVPRGFPGRRFGKPDPDRGTAADCPSAPAGTELPLLRASIRLLSV